MDKMKVFLHQIYECKKGVRSMVLCTLPTICKEQAMQKLEKNNIDYIIRPINDTRFNIFFGEKICLDVVEHFGDKPLNKLSPEEDFMLGAMLGYSINEQCKRFCRRNNGKVS